MDPGSQVKVFYIKGDTPDHFAVHFTSHAEQLMDMTDKINAYCTKEGEASGHVALHVGSSCLSKFEEDGYWYRAVVREHDPQNNTYKVSTSTVGGS